MWKVLPSNQNYEVSNKGRVRNLDGKILKPNKNSHRYFRIWLTDKKRKKQFYVHRLVAESFLGICPEGKVVNHKNANKLDNRIENLEYVTQSENIQHALSLNLYAHQK